MNAFIRKIRIDPTGLSIGSCKFASRRLQNFSGAREAPNLFRYPVGDFVEQRHTIGLCPQSDLSPMRESRVFDLEQLSAVVEDAKAAAFELHAEGKPLIGRNRDRDSVASLPADDVKCAAHAFDGLVEHDVVLECIGTDHVVVVRISSPPDNSARAILGAGNGLELYLNEAVFDVGVVLQQQGVSGSTGLFDYLRIRRRRLVLFDRPFWVTLAGLGRCPAFRWGANRV